LPRETWTPRVALTAGQLNVQAGRFRAAATILGGLKQVAPDFPPVRYWLGYALLGLDRPDEALGEFRTAVQKAPDNAFIRFALAQALLRTRNAREALAELNAVAKPLAKVPDYYV